LKIAKCKVQNEKCGKDTAIRGHTSNLHFEIYTLHFALAAAGGRAMGGPGKSMLRKKMNDDKLKFTVAL
jgi:hypothetical protein